VTYDMGTVLSQVGKSPRKGRSLPTLASSWPATSSSKGGVDEAKNAEVVSQMYAAYGKKSEADFLRAIADDLEWDEMAMPETSKGKEAAKKWFAMSTAAWADPKRTTANAWTMGDVVITEGVFTGKHVGRLGDIAPTKKDVTLHSVDIVQVKDGKVVKGWSYGNSAELMAQLGLMPMPGKTGGEKTGKPGDKPPPTAKADKPGAPKK
jgi:ketosteroid isomerase-like protein